MSDPKPTPTATPETWTAKEEIRIPQRDGTSVVLPEGHVMPYADARRLAKAGVVVLETGKQAKAEK